MIFAKVRSGGCCSYVIGGGETCGVVIDPELSPIDRVLALLGEGYVIDTHTDDFSASRLPSRGVSRVMHHSSGASDEAPAPQG